MRIVERLFGAMICFAVALGNGAGQFAQTPDTASVPSNWSISALPCLLRAPGEGLHVVCVTYGMCCATCWIEETQCQCEYTGFGGVVSAHFEGIGADQTALTDWQCGVDNCGRAPS